ncbi:unnamed protein product [Chilo suppressalis]|uniref:Zinc finger DNA binding protein n=1 Tax=Chilo suppressalis TaxID=168631 RepID=A0ABN8BIN2_CHISP|nr:unnamed protein product [Chilo suppressalis]
MRTNIVRTHTHVSSSTFLRSSLGTRSRSSPAARRRRVRCYVTHKYWLCLIAVHKRKRWRFKYKVIQLYFYNTMPNLTRSPLNKSYSMSDSDVDKLAKKDTEITHVPKRESKRRRMEHETEADPLDIRKIIREELCGVLSALQQQNSRMDVMEQHISVIKLQNDTTIEKNLDIEKSIQFIHDKVDDLHVAINGLEKNRKEVAAQISKIEDKCDALERFTRKTSVQIRNVPKQKDETKESLSLIITKLAASLSVNLQAAELRDVYRMPSKPDLSYSTVIVEFSTTILKNKFLAATKTYNASARKLKTEQLNSTHFGLTGPQSKIYVSEHLTAQSSRRYFLAREFCQTMEYDFCWTANGLIYLRKKQGEPHILVRTEAQLQSLKKI